MKSEPCPSTADVILLNKDGFVQVLHAFLTDFMGISRLVSNYCSSVQTRKA
jgi:hypothetical protein